MFDSPAAPWVSNPDLLPKTGGAYALKIELSSPASLPHKFGGEHLKPGRYVYAGSALGPGGIRARCARHLKTYKIRRWHIDWLTTQAKTVEVLALPDKTECQIIHSLSQRKESRIPLQHFGSSDCRTCPAHLVETILDVSLLSAILYKA